MYGLVFRRQPDRAAFGFTELGAVCFGDQRYGQTEHLLLVLATRQIDTRSDVAPLIGTADLQLHLVAVVQLGEIEALQQVIGKLGEGDAGVVAIQALLNRFLIDHLVDGEVLADVTQEGQHVHAAEPVVVVGRDSAVAAAVEIEERRNLFADFLNPLVHRIGGVQLALRRFEARIADEAGGAAHQRHRLVAGQLEALQAQQRNQMAQMQAVSGRIETAIQCNWPLRQSLR